MRLIQAFPPYKWRETVIPLIYRKLENTEMNTSKPKAPGERVETSKNFNEACRTVQTKSDTKKMGKNFVFIAGLIASFVRASQNLHY